MAYSGSSYGAAGGGSSSATTATTGSASIPDGARVLLFINVGDSTTATPSAVPSGFSSIASAVNSNANNGKLGKLMVYEKKVAASEASTYTVTFATAFDFDVTAVWATGRHATTAATVSAADNQASSGTLPISIGAAGLTAAANDDIIAFYGADGNGYAGTWSGTPPSGYTERHEGNCGAGAFGSYVATLDAASAGATGTLTATMTNASLTGADATAIIIALPVAAAGGGTLTATQGSYTLTGQSAGLLDGHTVAAAQGSYTLLGSAGLVDLSTVAAQGSYALNGQDTTLKGPSVLTAAQGSYTLTGQSVNFLRTIISAAAYGIYTLTGIAAALRYSGAPSTSAYPKWFPLVLAKHLYWLRSYTGLTAAAIAEADGAHVWAKRGVISHVIYIDVHSVPGYPRPGHP